MPSVPRYMTLMKRFRLMPLYFRNEGRYCPTNAYKINALITIQRELPTILLVQSSKVTIKIIPKIISLV